MSLHNAVTVDTAEKELGLSEGHSEGAVADAAAIEPALVATHPVEPATPEETEKPPPYADAGGTGEGSAAVVIAALHHCALSPVPPASAYGFSDGCLPLGSNRVVQIASLVLFSFQCHR